MSSREPRGLGKGLGALLGEVPNADMLRKPVGYVNKSIAGTKPAVEASDVFRIPIEQIEPNPFQPRMSFDQDALEELAESVRTLGLIQPITVRRIGPEQYQIISGERRYRACHKAGMTMIPAYVRDASDQGMLEMAIVENIQRQDLDPIELAMSYQRLIDECSLTQEQMAGRVGKKRASVTNILRLLKLPVKVQHDLKVGLLSVGHAKAILGVDDPSLQQDLCDKTVSEGLSVRELEALVRQVQKGGTPVRRTPSKPEAQLPEQYARLSDSMNRFFANRVSIRRGTNGKGTMTVHFSSDEEVEKFLEALK